MSFSSDTSVAIRSSRSIQEFRIDFFMEEEFAVDLAFAQTFVAACGSDVLIRCVEQVAHSVMDKHGEADLIVFLTVERSDGGGERLALLVEDKISAGFQPNQAQRYRARGEEGVDQGKWDSYLFVLVAPQTYIDLGHEFGAAVSLEQIKDWICPNDAGRRKFKIAKIDAAIHQHNTSGVQIVDADMTKFRQAYYEHLQEFNCQRDTDFEMRPPAPTYFRDSWFKLKSKALPARTELRHMAQAGNIEISFKDTDFSKAAELAECLEKGMTLISTGKHRQHVTIRIAAPAIQTFDDFERDRPKIRAALLSAERLWRFYQRERVRIDAILVPLVRPTP